MAEARELWRQDQPRLDPAHLVFIDETGTSTNMVRPRGRARRGTRLIGRVPHGHWKITTFVAGLRGGEIAAPFVIDRPMNSAIFLTGACPGESRGAAMLGPDPAARRHRHHGQSQAHKAKGVCEAIEAAGGTILYLPPCSPDLNPIEMAFAKLKTLLRKPAERSIEALWTTIGKLLDAFTAEECTAYLRHAGYSAT